MPDRNCAFEPIAGFDGAKAVDLIVFFAGKSSGKISKLKLIKLIYLFEREFIAEYGEPSLLDEYFSLKHGPVCSATLNIINKDLMSSETITVFRLRGRDVVLSVDPEEWEYDELTPADEGIAERVWGMHGEKSGSQIRNYTHVVCSEYTLVEHGRVSIPIEAIFAALGAPHAEEVCDEVASFRRISAIYG